ncbi:MAG: cysteine hydrolase [Oscillospiraceae bacterium]|nr:cysteine hydrolase [Oscillospiraceae bacterium]
MKKVLVVIDMQNDFINGAIGSPAAQAIIPNVAQKIDEYKKSGNDIIFTRDTHERNYLETQEGKNLPVVHCLEGTPGWQIASGLNVEGCKIIDKPSFGSIELAEYLKNTDYDEIELVGLVSSICVISNALIIKAYLPEIKITVDASCTAGVTDEDYKASLVVMKMCHINVLDQRN